MKIAIITDVHGNYPALKAVLDDIRRKQDIARIFCLGDMIGIGPNTNEVIDTIFSRNDVSILTGNHEEAVLHIIEGKGTLVGHEQAAEHHEWVAGHLKKEYIPVLRGLPRSFELELEGHNLLMIHYHMKDNKLESIDNEPTGAKLDLRYQDSPYHLVCFGHHHPVHYYKTDTRIYVNPGALGCHNQPFARYGIVELTQGKMDVRLVEVPYDNLEFLQSYEYLQVPDRQFILKIFHGNQLENGVSDGSST